jgi:hypothetical protein
MDLVETIGTGAGLAAAAGIRPFLPVLLTGALASSDTGIDFDGTDWSFLESPGFLLAALILLAAVVFLQRRRAASPDAAESPVDAALAGLSLGAGAVLFAGALASDGDTAWTGLIAGLACAGLGLYAIGDLLRRAGARLDHAARAALPFYADAASLVLAGVAILWGPLSFLALVLLAILLVRGRRREGEKYAGLRILR